MAISRRSTDSATRTNRLPLVALCAFLLAPVSAPAADPPESLAVGMTRGEKPRPVPRSTSPIRIDGKLTEAAWDEALHIGLPYEVDPGENTSAPVGTDAYLLYDNDRLYAAFRAHDPRPLEIRGRLSDRDGASRDDYVGLVIDTFNDERRAFVFMVNALGVQTDLIQDDVGGNEDESWDAIWASAGRVTETGYDVELSIPYSSLSFQHSSGPQVWGLDLIRQYPRERRRTLASNRRDRNVSCYLCQLSKIVGFEHARPGRNLEIVPTLVAGRTDTNPSFPDDGLVAGDAETDLGVTARWGVTPNLGVSATVNPDFSQVEADVAQLDVNEQFALFFPEKRPFFLEGADLFDTPFDAVYTRTIANPAWGGRFTGKEGRNAFGAVVAHDDPETDLTLLLPGPQDSSLVNLAGEFDVGILRYRRDMANHSTLGMVATSRIGDDYSNHVLGVDALIRLTDVDSLRYHLLGSQTEYPDSIVRAHDQPEGRFEDHAFSLSYKHASRDWGAKGGYEEIGPDFRADLGFVPQVGYSNAEVGAWRTWWPGSTGMLSWVELGGNWKETKEDNGDLIERETSLSLQATGPMQSYGSLNAGTSERFYKQVRFDLESYGAFLQLNYEKDLYLGLGVSTGRQIDYAFEPDPADPTAPAARDGREFELSPSLRYNLGRHVRFDLSHDYRSLEIADGVLFRANLTELRLIHQFNVRAFVRAIVQYGQVDRDLSLYPDCDDGSCHLQSEEREAYGQFLFSYKVNPRTALYLGYTDSAEAETNTSLVTTERSFFFKLGYAWLP